MNRTTLFASSGRQTGLIAIAMLMLGFLGLGAAMLGGWLESVDHALMLRLRGPGGLGDPIGSHSVEEAVRDLTALGGTTLVTLFTAVVAGLLLAQGRQRQAAALVGAILLAWLSKDAAKALFDRARPDILGHEVFVHSASFPSGHTTLASALYLTLAMLASRSGLGIRGRVIVYGFAATLSFLVGFSRVYLGVHWPSDVLAGWCLGALWATTAWVLLEASTKSGQVR